MYMCICGAGTMAPRPFRSCVECDGASGLPRNGKQGATCTAFRCKAAYKKKRNAASAAAVQPPADEASAQTTEETMPNGMWVQDLTEILGERCCELRQMSHKKRKNGPGSLYCQYYLVRGMFLEDDGDEEDEDDAAPEPNTFWVSQVDLLETIAKEDIEAALVARHEKILEDL